MSKQLATKISRLLSLALRHAPESLGVSLDQNGWCKIDALLIGLKQKGYSIDEQTLLSIVISNEKKRFSFDESKTFIRANQGHSLNIDLGLNSEVPPEYLYHGSAVSNITSITLTGLKKNNRDYVHLSTDLKTVMAVGKRHGDPVVLKVSAGKMHREGYEFYLSANDVWLTDSVPPEYLQVI
ncbi:RNA 2'-phosphotransferase [Mucilaginibacter koreensis]